MKKRSQLFVPMAQYVSGVFILLNGSFHARHQLSLISQKCAGSNRNIFCPGREKHGAVGGQSEGISRRSSVISLPHRLFNLSFPEPS